MRRVLALLALLIVAGLSVLAAAPAAAGEVDWGSWATSAGERHPLAGRSYEARSGKLSGLADDGARLLLPEGIVLLGEVHDNPGHHLLRAWLIEQTARARPQWRPGVVLEQIDTGQQGALNDFLSLARPAGERPSARELMERLQWDKSGWPPSELYEPLLDAVIGAHLPILAGNLPRDRVRELARGGTAGLSAEDRAALRIDAPMPAPLAEALHRELAESHCGALPPQAIPGMALAQRYRDGHMAEALFRAAGRHGSAILIAGNGHVRSDRGVPWHIRERRTDVPVMSVALVEVEEGETDPAAYLPRDPHGNPAVDLVIFTPRAERSDPCAGLRKDRR